MTTASKTESPPDVETTFAKPSKAPPHAGGFVLIINPLNGDPCPSTDLVVDGEYGGSSTTHVECKLYDATGTTEHHSQGPTAVSGDGTFQFVFSSVDMEVALVVAHVRGTSGTLLDTDSKDISVS